MAIINTLRDKAGRVLVVVIVLAIAAFVVGDPSTAGLFNSGPDRDIAEIDLRSKARNRDQKFELYQSIYSEVQDDSDDGKWYFFKRLLRVRRKARHHLMKLMQEKK